jgi:PAS domain S-box-containing protein
MGAGLPLDGAAIRALLSQSPLVLFAFDREGVFTFSEGRGLAPLGRDGRSSVGRSLFEVYATRPDMLANARRVLAGETVHHTLELDGVWYTATMVPQLDAAGAPCGGVGLALEITEQQRAAELLRGLDFLVWVSDAETLRFSFVSERAVELLGHELARLSEEERTLAHHLHPGEREPTLALCRRVAADGQERTFVHRLLAVDGREHWFRTTVRAVDQPGRPRQLVGMMLEVTERRAAERFLTESETRFQLMVEQLPAICYTVDRELRFTTGAGKGLARLGLREDHTLDHISLYEYLQTNDPQHPSIAAHQRAIAGEAVDYESEWLGRVFQSHVLPFHDEGGQITGAVGVSLDITERKRAEQERDRLLAKEQAARAAAEEALRLRDEFLAVAAHELLTPMTSLRLTLQSLLVSQEQGLPTPERALATADRQSRRLLDLIDGLLNVSRLDAGALELALDEVDLAALVREVTARFAMQLQNSGTTLTLHADEPVIGRWDRSRLDQVITNLLSNASKYAAGKPVELSVTRDGERARLEIRDQGIGIDPARLPHIFERFERAVSPRYYGGLGLGLFIVRRLVEAHGGQVRAESTLDVGSTFVVELPIAGTPEVADARRVR